MLFFTILMVQSSLFGASGGAVGSFAVDGLRRMIGSVGVWIFNITIFVLSLVLIFEDRFTDIIKNCFIGSRDESSQDEIGDDFASDADTLQRGGLARHSSAQGLRGAENFNALNDALSGEDNSAKQGNFAEQGASGRSFEGERNLQNLNDTREPENEQNFSDAQGPQASTERELKMPQKGKPSRLKRVERLSEVAENKRLLDQLDKGRVAKPKDFKLPPLDFLNPPPKKKSSIDESEIDRKIYDLLDKLRKFKIDGDVVRTYSGPVVTTFEFRPAAHIKVSKILTLQDDLAMALRAQTIRIQAPVPGKDVVGIEIPNQNIDTIYLREILESDVFKSASSPLTIVLGKDIVGQPFVTDLKKLPHLLIAGTTGSGKSVGINAMLLSLLYRNSPQTLRLMMIDPKMLEFSIYNDIPHLLTPVITQAKQAITALSNMVAEMERRYKIMSHTRTKNIESYNEKMKEEGGEQFPYIVVIIDELADLMMTSGKDVELYIGRLAQMARASGIHLIVATQRPSVDVVTGLIKANLPSRISYRVGQRIDSKVILDQMGAESLLGRGDMLFTPPGSPGVIRLHAPFASEKEIDTIVNFLKAQQEVVYDDRFLVEEGASGGSGTGSGAVACELDELYEEAKEIVLSEQKTSISYLQRRLKIGYNRAATIIEQMEQMGVLSPMNAKGQRDIL